MLEKPLVLCETLMPTGASHTTICYRAMSEIQNFQSRAIPALKIFELVNKIATRITLREYLRDECHHNTQSSKTMFTKK